MWLLVSILVLTGNGSHEKTPKMDFLIFQTEAACQHTKAKLHGLIYQNLPKSHASLTCVKLNPLGQPT